MQRWWHPHLAFEFELCARAGSETSKWFRVDDRLAGSCN